MMVLAILMGLLVIIMTTQIVMLLKLRQTQLLLNQLFDEVKQQNYAITDVSNHLMGHSDLLNKIRATLEAEKIENITQQSHQASDSAYKQALKMVEIGANLEDIVTTCSLTRAEVQLLMSLKQFDSAEQIS